MCIIPVTAMQKSLVRLLQNGHLMCVCTSVFEIDSKKRFCHTIVMNVPGSCLNETKCMVCIIVYFIVPQFLPLVVELPIRFKVQF